MIIILLKKKTAIKYTIMLKHAIDIRLKNLFMTIVEDIWTEILKESKNKISLEPESESLFQKRILSCSGLDDSLSAKLADDLATKEYSSETLKDKFYEVFSNIVFLEKAVIDLKAVKERDPASSGYVFTLLFSKGFAALQAHRIANYFMRAKQEVFAYFIQSRSSALYEVDIHPKAERDTELCWIMQLELSLERPR